MNAKARPVVYRRQQYFRAHTKRGLFLCAPSEPALPFSVFPFPNNKCLPVLTGIIDLCQGARVTMIVPPELGYGYGLLTTCRDNFINLPALTDDSALDTYVETVARALIFQGARLCSSM